MNCAARMDVGVSGKTESAMVKLFASETLYRAAQLMGAQHVTSGKTHQCRSYCANCALYASMTARPKLHHSTLDRLLL